MEQVVNTLEDPENTQNCEELGVEDLDKEYDTKAGHGWSTSLF